MKVIDYQNVDMTEEEFKYYEELADQCTTDSINGKQYFKNLFKTDNDGIIKVIHPKISIPWVILHFVQQVQINQHLRLNDKRIALLEKNIENIIHMLKHIELPKKM